MSKIPPRGVGPKGPGNTGPGAAKSAEGASGTAPRSDAVEARPPGGLADSGSSGLPVGEGLERITRMYYGERPGSTAGPSTVLLRGGQEAPDAQELPGFQRDALAGRLKAAGFKDGGDMIDALLGALPRRGVRKEAVDLHAAASIVVEALVTPWPDEDRERRRRRLLLIREKLSRLSKDLGAAAGGTKNLAEAEERLASIRRLMEMAESVESISD